MLFSSSVDKQVDFCHNSLYTNNPCSTAIAVRSGGGGTELFMCPYTPNVQARPPRDQRLATQSRVSGWEGYCYLQKQDLSSSPLLTGN